MNAGGEGRTDTRAPRYPPASQSASDGWDKGSEYSGVGLATGNGAGSEERCKPGQAGRLRAARGSALSTRPTAVLPQSSWVCYRVAAAAVHVLEEHWVPVGLWCAAGSAGTTTRSQEEQQQQEEIHRDPTPAYC